MDTPHRPPHSVARTPHPSPYRATRSPLPWLLVWTAVSTGTLPTIAAGAPASAGLVNDLLRKESPGAAAWDLGGQLRTRFESKQEAGSFPNRDFLDGLENSNDYLLFRTKVHLGYTPNPWIQIYTEGRDSHSLGDERAVSETDAFDLHQAFVRIGDLSAFPLQAQVGRLELLYGDERYVGISDWSNTGRSFDAARLRFEQEGIRVDALGGRQVVPRDRHFNRVNDYDWITGIYASSRRWTEFQDTEMFAFSRSVANGSPTAFTPSLGGPTARDVVTVGTRWKSVPGKLGPWDYTFEGAAQFGSLNAVGGRLEHRGYAVNASGGYSWSKAWATPRLGVGYDFGSGDGDPTDGENHTVELLYGTNHKLYGLADLFGMRNLHIPRMNATLKPSKDLNVTVEWLGYWMVETADFLYPESSGARAQNGYTRHADFDSFVAHEVDLLVNWKLSGWAQVQAAYAHVFAGNYVEQSAASAGRDARGADWFSLQAVFHF